MLRALDDLSDINDGQIAKHRSPAGSPSARSNHRPTTPGRIIGENDINEFHEDKGAENISKKSQGKGDRLDNVIQNLEWDQRRLRIDKRPPESFDPDKTNPGKNHIANGEQRKGDREHKIFRGRRKFENRKGI